MNADEYYLYQALYYWQHHKAKLAYRNKLYYKNHRYIRHYDNEYKRKWRARNPKKVAAFNQVLTIYKCLRRLEEKYYL